MFDPNGRSRPLVGPDDRLALIEASGAEGRDPEQAELGHRRRLAELGLLGLLAIDHAFHHHHRRAK